MEEGKCWAAFLGGCGGQITKEHIVTQGLFKRRVRVDGLDGWLGTQKCEMPIRKITSNILCEHHNNELGRTADSATIRLLKHLKAIRHPMELPGSRILRPPVERHVSGLDLGRWLCKTHCNLMIINGMAPDPEYIRYAFLRPITKPIYFFFAGQVGEEKRFADSRDAVVSYRRLIANDDTGYDAFSISLAGFQSVVSLIPVQQNGKEMIDRINELQQPTPLGMSKIIFDWSEEPGVISDIL
ncbi:MAG: hypothetical protein ABIK07_03540 [Planctomycetota bacterium]